MRLDRTLSSLRPKLLILDPFVRLHRIDENNSGEVAPILANLRHLQRTYGIAIVVVHHAKKGASYARAGQALRGSSEFHAWGDCNLYMRRDNRENLTLSIEHRAEASISGIPLRLKAEGSVLSLQLDVDRGDPEGTIDHLGVAASATQSKSNAPEIKILKLLKESNIPLPMRALRDACGIRTASACAAVQALIKTGQVSYSGRGYSAL